MHDGLFSVLTAKTLLRHPSSQKTSELTSRNSIIVMTQITYHCKYHAVPNGELSRKSLQGKSMCWNMNHMENKSPDRRHISIGI
mmetsp:Transcript_15727/g.23903  ORF Transcript_15727/g.23903 Transcript_15727/m.23903 type:complete len:84 (-) Transcript_15727:42-293(-)